MCKICGNNTVKKNIGKLLYDFCPVCCINPWMDMGFQQCEDHSRMGAFLVSDQEGFLNSKKSQ